MVNSDVEELAKMSPHGSPSQVDDDAEDGDDCDGGDDGQEQSKSAFESHFAGSARVLDRDVGATGGEVPLQIQVGDAGVFLSEWTFGQVDFDTTIVDL